MFYRIVLFPQLPPSLQPLSLKHFWLRTSLRHILFAKSSILNVWHCPEYFCLDNCSLICTVALCYVLHQKYSEFLYMQRSVFLGKSGHIQLYSALLRHIDAYWDIIKAYCGFFRHTHHPVLPLHVHKFPNITLPYSAP